MVVVLKRMLLGALCASTFSACGEDLGQCDPTMLGGSNVQGMVRPHDGQAIISSSCASGRCHSADAEGEERVGAPGGLNFDTFTASVAEMGKVTAGGATVVDWAEEMWAEIDSGSMPPEPPAGGGELSAADKEKVRNWLACGAPIIPADPSAPSATWDSIWPALATNCISCHSTAAGAPNGIGMGFVFGDSPTDICASYANIVAQDAVTPMCSPAGSKLVVAGNPSASMLLKKISDASDKCGGPMPPTGDPLIVSNPQLVALIEQWIMNGALKPPSCP